MSLEDKLAKACEFGDLAAVNRLLKNQHLDVHAGQEYAFWLAVFGNHIPVIQRLLKLKGYRKINLRAIGNSALCQACEHGNLKMVRILLEAGCTPTKGRYNCFIMACIRGNLSIVDLLLTLKGRQQVDVHAEDEYAFLIARLADHWPVVERLLQLTGSRAIKLSNPKLSRRMTHKVKILIIKSLLVKMRRSRLLDQQLKQKYDILYNRERVLSGIRAIPSGQDYYQAKLSFEDSVDRLSPKQLQN